MTVDELIDLLKASNLGDGLTSLQELILRYSWEGKTYAAMATETNYVKEYLSSTASTLWSSLSDFWDEPITKNNLRQVLEPRPLTRNQRSQIEQFRCQSTVPLLEFPGGPVTLNSKFYIERPPIEELARSEITKPGSILRIRAPWKMGKTSLMLRIFDYAESEGYQVVNIDFQQAEKTIFQSTDKFFRWFSLNVSRKLRLAANLDDYWDEEMGSKVSCTIYFEAYLLENLSVPLVLGLNEVNYLFEYPAIAEDFFSLLRSWYEQSKSSLPWQKLRLVLAYSTEIYIPLQIHQSPFNVGLPFKLPPFTAEQSQTLAHLYGLDLNASQVKQLMGLVGGHPYLIQLALYYLCRGDFSLKQLIQEATTEGGIYSSHLRQIFNILQSDPAMEAFFKQVVSVEYPVKISAILAYKLDSLGLVNMTGNSVAPSCELYRTYFANQFLNS